MSEKVDYNPDLLVLYRGRLTDGIVAMTIITAVASFAWECTYTEDALGTLLLDSETATLSIAWWDGDGDEPLRVGDEVFASYDGNALFHGTCEAFSVESATDQDAVSHASNHKNTMTATMAGDYANALARVPKDGSWTTAEGAAQRAVSLLPVTNVTTHEIPSNQAWAQGVPALTAGDNFSPLSALRDVASVAMAPFRFAGPNELEIIDAATEPDLPTGFTSGEGAEMYSSSRFDAARPPHWIYLQGQNYSDG